MAKKVLTAEQIREEVRRRIHQDKPAGEDRVEIPVPLPKVHAVDAETRNWNMESIGHAGHDAYVRRVIEEARREFFLSDAAEHDEKLGDSIARR
ncbi:hypothetical protein OKW30_008219 [Paraburkholderia sp. Clong3]|uniref:hypothetical protein n=1 Tax=Paraburkholderia sp. Clong3 TaxID=2991061 RepID=UPI003D2428D6